MKKCMLLFAVVLGLFPVAAQAKRTDDRATAKTFDGIYKIKQTGFVRRFSGDCNYEQSAGEPKSDYSGTGFGVSGRFQFMNLSAPIKETYQLYLWRSDIKSTNNDLGADIAITYNFVFKFFLPRGPHSSHADVSSTGKRTTTWPARPGYTDDGGNVIAAVGACNMTDTVILRGTRTLRSP
jgi:hypothetical protein